MAKVKAPLEEYDVTFTDVHAGEANFGWCARYTIPARSPRHALRLAKQKRYGKGNVPRHNVKQDNGIDGLTATVSAGTVMVIID